jgi:tRNA nucleotidyltransferase (CCA-adding enzyme)
VRLATLFHDLGKPGGAPDHAAAAAELTAPALRRLRYSNALSERVVAIVRSHPFLLGEGDGLEARELLARYGDELAGDLLAHWRADLTGRDQTPAVQERLARLAAFRDVVAREEHSPHRLGDLAIDGSDLIGLGFTPGPALGDALAALLRDVVRDPSRNERELLLARARELQGA